MPKTLFTAEELSTFIRKAILVCVGVTLLNGVAIFLVTCSVKQQGQSLQKQIVDNNASLQTLDSAVTQDITNSQTWREQFGYL